MADTILHADGLYHVYESKAEDGNVVALRGLHIDMKEGEAIAVVGPSGSGKSRQKKIFTQNGWSEIVSFVTRPPRGDSDAEYEFTTEEEWKSEFEKGNFVSPSLFGNVQPDHVLAQEEIFGPVQVLIPFKDEEEAIRIANGTKFGLVAGIWTKDGSRQMRMAKQLKAGQVFVNNYGAGGGVELPFGGVGHSGFGREKGFEALKGFSVIKTVAVNHG